MKHLNFQKTFQLYLGLIAFMICALPKLITIGILGLLVFTVIGYRKKAIRFKLEKPVLLLALLYIAYLVGVCFTQNQYLASRYVENKLAFLVFPILLSFRFSKPMDLRPVVGGLVAGVSVASLLGLINSWKCYTAGAGSALTTCLTSGNFSHLHHPSYFSVFLIIAITAVWYGYFNRWQAFRLAWIIPFSLFALLMYGLCLSLAGFLFLFLLGFALIVIWMRRKLGKKAFAISLIILPLLAALMFIAVPEVKRQFADAESFLVEYTSNPEQFVRSKTGYKEGNEVRLIMWTVSVKEMAQHPLGVGTGNVDEHLSRRLSSYKQVEMAAKDEHGAILYNPHNQFFQTGLEIGLIGLVILLLMIGTSIRFARKHANWILLILMASLVFNSLFESMFQRQSGIVFYSFWLCVLVIYSNSKIASEPAPSEE